MAEAAHTAPAAVAAPAPMETASASLAPRATLPSPESRGRVARDDAER